MKETAVFFYIDALGSSFLSSSMMPFLSNLAKKHYYQQLENVLGYSFAIQSSMLSGLYPEDNDQWMPYFYSPENSPLVFKAFGKIGSVLFLDKLPVIRYLTMWQTRKFFLREGVHANNTPSSVMGKIGIYPYYYMNELPSFHELRSIFHYDYETSLAYLGPPNIRDSIYVPFMEYLQRSRFQKEVIIGYDDTLDGLGHKYGPHSTECIFYAKHLDRVLFSLYEKMTNIFSDFTFIVFSDHSQCEQVHEVNILSKLKEKGLRFGVDYIGFVDATMVLFWPKNEFAREKIQTILNTENSGKTINQDLRAKYHLKFKDKKYGEIIFVLKPGYTFFPNFFDPFSSMKGLHGYLPEEEVQKSFVISNKELPSLKHVRDIKGALLNLFS